MTKKEYKIHIIGAGVSGLIAARVLENYGYNPIIIEATDNEEVSSVILYLDGNEVQTFTEPPYRYIWNTVGQIDDIIYTIHAHVVDNNSNQTTLGPINITIDNEEPTDNISPTLI